MVLADMPDRVQDVVGELQCTPLTLKYRALASEIEMKVQMKLGVHDDTHSLYFQSPSATAISDCDFSIYSIQGIMLRV